MRMLTWVTKNHVTIMIAVSSRVSAFCCSAQSDSVSKCVFDKKPRWTQWTKTKRSLETKSVLDSFIVSTVSRKILHIIDRTRNRHWWTSRVDSGVEWTILKELGKIIPYLRKKGYRKVTQKWGWRLFTKKLGLCKMVTWSIGSDVCPVLEV